MSDYVDEFFARRGMRLTPAGELAVIAAGAVFMLGVGAVSLAAFTLLASWVVVGA